MADTNESIVRTMYQAVNDRDFTRLESLAGPGAETEDVPFESSAPFIDSWRNWMDAFPDTQIEVKRLVTAGDTVVAEILARGTHRGPLSIPDGEIAPTHRRVEAWICEIWELAEGKIVDGRSFFDWAGIERDLALREAMPSAQRMAALEESAFPPH